jgi:hypothetical protein
MTVSTEMPQTKTIQLWYYNPNTGHNAMSTYPLVQDILRELMCEEQNSSSFQADFSIRCSAYKVTQAVYTLLKNRETLRGGKAIPPATSQVATELGASKETLRVGK